MEIRDEILMQRVKEGALSEMAILFGRYNIIVYNYFLKMTRNTEISNDLTQNLFLRMIRYRGSFRMEYTFKAWMFRIARNICTDHFNAEKLKGEVFPAADFLASDREDETGGYGEEDFRKLDRSLDLLRNEDREILVMSRYLGMKYSEISEITSLSVPAIKVTVHRALKQLRTIYFRQV